MGAAIAALGYKPVPVMPNSKSPGQCRMGVWSTMPEWQELRDKPLGPYDVKIWGGWEDANIGVILGNEVTPGWEVGALDFDTDDVDDLERIQSSIPHSTVTKRGQRGFTAFYLFPSGTKGRRFKKAGETIFEILSGNGTRQTVIPPSIHPDTGKPYAWTSSHTLADVQAGDLVKLDSDSLEKLVDTVQSIAGVDVGRVPASFDGGDDDDGGSPHRQLNTAALHRLSDWVPQLGLAKLKATGSGFVAIPHWRANRKGWSDDKRNPSLGFSSGGIRDFSADVPHSPLDVVMLTRGGDLDSAFEWLARRLGRWNEDDSAWPALDAAMGEPNPGPANDDMPAHDPETGEVLDMAPPTLDELPPAAPEDSTEALTHVPGLVGEVLEWIVGTSRYPNRVLALGAAVAVVGTLVGRRIGGPTMSGTHLYIVVLAPTAAGKDHALRCIPKLLQAAGAEKSIGPSQFMSMTALTQSLAETPQCLSAMDEFGAYLGKLTDPRANPHEKMVTAILREAWGASFEPMPLPRWANSKNTIVDSPALSLYGASTPEEFFDALQGKDVINGFLNRFLILTTDVTAEDRDPPMGKAVPPALKAALAKLYAAANANTALDVANPFGGKARQMDWKDEAARAEFERVKAVVKPLRDNEASRAFYARTVEMGLRLATIRAVGQDVNGTVSAEDMRWGFDVASLSARMVMAAAEDNMAPNDFARHGNSIVKFMKKRAGPFTRRDFSQHMKALTKQDLTNVLDKLCEAGRIDARMPPPKPGPGRPQVSMSYSLPKGGKAA